MPGTFYRADIEAAAGSQGLSADLVEAVVRVESAGYTDAFRFEAGFWTTYLAGKPEWAHANPRRVSSSYGLMQVMFVVAKELGFVGEPELLFVPSNGLRWGCAKLRELLDWTQAVNPSAPEDVRVRSALAAYNGGKFRNAPDTQPDRNAAYAEAVMRFVPGRTFLV